MASGEAVRVRGLVKSYGDVHAVAGVDFDIASGEVVVAARHFSWEPRV